MSTEMAVYGGPPTPGQYEIYKDLAARFNKTEFVPKALRGRPEAVLACIVTGHELGIGPMQSLKSIRIIEGSPSISAELMAALVRRAGHSISGISTDVQAKATGKRHDTQDTMTVGWTIDMAKRAGLSQKNNWKQYPEAMLWSRAVSQLCRQLFADVVAGMSHTPDELGDDGPVALSGDAEEAQTRAEPSVLDATGHPILNEESRRIYGDDVILAAAQKLTYERGTTRHLAAIEELQGAPEEFLDQLAYRLENEADAAESKPEWD